MNFKRGGLVSWAAVLIVTITLAVITSILLLQAALSYSLSEIRDKVDVTIYFVPGASEDGITILKTELEKLPEVAQVSYVSAEQALALFRERHKDDYPTIAALDEIGSNPLGAYLNVRARQVSQYETIAKYLQSENALTPGGEQIIDKVNYYQNELVINRLNSIIAGAQRLGFLITLLLIFISAVITFNTIRLAIYISKEEIAVMRLVGASNSSIRGPFMVEGAIYGVVATLFTLILFWPVTHWLGRNMTSFWGLDLSKYYLSNFWQILIILLIFGVFLAMISSYLAVRKYLSK